MYKKFTAVALSAALVVPTMAQAADGGESQFSGASDLRADLDHLLSEHFILAASSMQKTYDESSDWEEVEWALDENVKDMGTALEPLYGEEGAAEFVRIFESHNGYTDDYVKAVKDGDDSAKEEAEQNIAGFADEFSSFLDEATEGNLPKEAAEEALVAHEQDVQATFDHYSAGDYMESYESYRVGYDRMFDISKVLSGAITAQFPDMFDGSVESADAELRSTLNQLAGEHFALASLELEKGYTQAEDFDFVTWAEDEHTADFKAAIEGIYGAEGADQFETVWQQDHINAQSDLAIATLEGDEEARDQAIEHLKTFSQDFGSFLATATEGNLPEEAAQDAVWTHEEQVIKTFDQFVEEDYEASVKTYREGYAFMFGIGETLGGAIKAQMPDQFGDEAMPEEMPQTGFGGASDQSSMMAWLSGMVALALGGLYLFRRKENQNNA
ncbi:LPXTG cell wall anchor domain-containing protein [Alkalicoccobacillus gibsonii]|uniref:LPXTG cell wall anchor domain-containing protein n=1 Tax=Alkalicoccobacillus gibsonii TaxID=79881 RepID=A0ABU9VKV5_9BACI